MLAILIARAKEAGHVGSLIPHLVEGGVSVLKYADDTIIFMEHDLEKMVNMKLILCIFEQLSGLKIFKRVNYFVLAKHRIWNINIKKFLGVLPDLCHSST
jgi:hypothetical protein